MALADQVFDTMGSGEPIFLIIGIVLSLIGLWAYLRKPSDFR